MVYTIKNLAFGMIIIFMNNSKKIFFVSSIAIITGLSLISCKIKSDNILSYSTNNSSFQLDIECIESYQDESKNNEHTVFITLSNTNNCRPKLYDFLTKNKNEKMNVYFNNVLIQKDIYLGNIHSLDNGFYQNLNNQSNLDLFKSLMNN
ncbi:hypothetical protein BML2496_38380 [Providencia rettgeri]|nr:hypothetical protein BML2496_38380 [Providencia rettgeri]